MGTPASRIIVIVIVIVIVIGIVIIVIGIVIIAVAARLGIKGVQKKFTQDLAGGVGAGVIRLNPE